MLITLYDPLLAKSFWMHKILLCLRILMQIFQLSFSTIVINRGLGTCSIKLLGEKYLKVKVYFKSEEGFGNLVRANPLLWTIFFHVISL